MNVLPLQYVIGVDPGAHGALAFLRRDATKEAGYDLFAVIDMPTHKRKRGVRMVNEVDAPELSKLLDSTIGRPFPSSARAFVERVGAMPGQGVSSMFAFGRALGVVEGVLAEDQIPYEFLPPVVWRQAAGVPVHKDKACSRARAAEEFPAMASLFTRAKDDGRAESALIALAGALRLQAGKQ